ncbi:MAG: hypothetical protein EBS42_04455 [Caulobacteraceae bacterium]|nr:hypothetical protein [Caulobacteraceae bacterium]
MRHGLFPDQALLPQGWAGQVHITADDGPVLAIDPAVTGEHGLACGFSACPTRTARASEANRPKTVPGPRHRSCTGSWRG